MPHRGMERPTGAAWIRCLRVHRHRKTVGVQDNRDPALGCLNPLDKPDSLEIWKDTGRWVYGYSCLCSADPWRTHAAGWVLHIRLVVCEC